MSSYLNIVIPIKDKEVENAISIVCVTASHPLYRAFSDNLNLPYGPEKAYELTLSDIAAVYDSVNKDVEDAQKRLNELEKYANGNIDIINEILSCKEYLKEQEEVFYYVKYLMSTLSTMTEEWRTVKHTLMYYCD